MPVTKRHRGDPLSIDQREALAGGPHRGRRAVPERLFYREDLATRLASELAIPRPTFGLEPRPGGHVVLIMEIGGERSEAADFGPDEWDLAQMAVRAFSVIEWRARV